MRERKGIAIDNTREVKFGALMKELATEDTWIATGIVVTFLP